MTTYNTLIFDAKAFYSALDANNTRDWWQENKTTYDTSLKIPAMALLDELSGPLANLAEAPIKTKLFRPHRDVRFSKDKTPYNTHLHMMWQIESGAQQSPVFFFGIGLNYVSAGAGMMSFDKTVLLDWRKMVDLDTDRIMGIIASVEEQGFRLREPDLKRVPPPYDKDHVAQRLLRMKGMVASKELNEMEALPDQLMTAYATLWPLNELLISIASN